MNFKKMTTVAFAIACVMSTTAFAADTKTEVKEKPVYTYEQVLEKVLKNNSDLSLLEQNLELMDKQSSNVAQELGSLVYPTGTTQYVTVENYAALARLNNLTVNKQTQAYKKESLLKQAEYSVMTTMTEITANEDALLLADKELSIYKSRFNVANIKHMLGMVSENDVLKAKAELDKYEADLAQTKLKTESAYKGLARLMGISSADFTIDYSVEYVPYKLVGTINEFAAKKLQTNPVLVGARVGVENLKNNKSIMVANDTTPYGYDSVMYNIADAEASLKSAENGYKKMSEATYEALVQMEGGIKNAEDNLVIAQKNLAATDANFKAGRATQLQLDEATLSVKKLENTIDTLKANYMSTTFSFENPCVGGATASAK